jgi:hypothetical protein
MTLTGTPARRGQKSLVRPRIAKISSLGFSAKCGTSAFTVGLDFASSPLAFPIPFRHRIDYADTNNE